MNEVHLTRTESLGFLTVTTNRLMGALLRKRLIGAGIDLTAEQWGLLLQLWDHDGMAQDDLSRIVCLEKSSLSRVAAIMEDKGLLERRRDPDDGRRKRLFPTDAAYALREPATLVAGTTLTRALEGVSAVDLETCIAVLKHVKKNLQEHENDNST